jgi:alpha-galactosidase
MAILLPALLLLARLLLALVPVVALDNGLALTPPLGWRSYNAFGGRPTQQMMESMMAAMVDRSRTVDGKPTSLLDLGYKHLGLDGGWNFCYPENHTFHWKSDGRPVWNAAFPDPKGMVARAHTLGLSPGWYLNNCGCAENHLDEAMTDLIMEGSVRMLAEQEWDGVKFVREPPLPPAFRLV